MGGKCLRGFGLLLAAIAAVPAMPVNLAHAQTTIGDATAMGLTGSCDKLILGKQKLADSCSGKLLNMSYPDGRVGFYFILDDGLIVTFSGMDAPNPTPDTDVVKVDKVIMGVKGKPKDPEVVAATGTCTYGNPYKGESTVSCDGTMSNGQRFSARFTSDGKPPT
ncbi:hypothetical protein HFN11_25245 [Rhizobium leguminosarum]|nr:hypothetical protein [Rhizobium leguminosarum]MBY5381667.1 hypothetical protein [Rhizobium leguminosarum]NEH68845.1 hypothetical protein [Rhizobium leguminosarum]